MKPRARVQRDADAVARVLRGPVGEREVNQLTMARVQAMSGRAISVKVYHYLRLVRLETPVTVRIPAGTVPAFFVDDKPQKNGRWIVDIIVPAGVGGSLASRSLRADLDGFGREINYGDWHVIEEP